MMLVYIQELLTPTLDGRGQLHFQATPPTPWHPPNVELDGPQYFVDMVAKVEYLPLPRIERRSRP
jgi:hypothetical protein